MTSLNEPIFAPPSYLDICGLLTNSPKEFGRTLREADPDGLFLVQAARTGDTRSLTALIDVAGFHPDIHSESAVKDGDVEGHASLDKLEQRTPLSWAAGQGHTAATAALLERGADLDRMDARGMTALHWAASEGRVEDVKLLLKSYNPLSGECDNDNNEPGKGKGPETEAETETRQRKTPQDWMDISGRTPLSRAAAAGHAEVVKILLEEGSEEDSLGFDLLDLEDSQGRTPLSWAAGNGHKDVLQSLLDIVSAKERAEAEKGWKEEERNWWRRTPLESAREQQQSKGKQPIAAIFAGLGLDFGHADYQGWTPLTWAAKNGHTSIIELLLDNGDDPEFEDSQKSTPLWWAAAGGHEEAVRTLLQKGAVTEHEGREGTALSQALYYGHEAVISLLQHSTSKPKKQPAVDREALLWWAVVEGHAAFVASMLQSGVSPDHLYASEQRPLLLASAKGDEAIVNLLLTHGANTEVKGSWWSANYGIPGYEYGHNRTPISWAAGNGHVGTVKLLLNKGASLEAKDNANWTPLAWAAGNGHTEVVELLLQHGADLEIAEKTRPYYYSSDNNSGRETPLGAAIKGNHLGVAKLIIDKALERLTPEPVIDLKDKDRRSLLSWAAILGHDTAISQLLSREEFKEIINDQDSSSQSPLLFASQGGHDSIVRLLLENGASVKYTDEKRRSPLWFAANNGHEACVRLLLDKNADPLIIDKVVWDTSTHRAAVNNHIAVVSLLLDRGVDVDVHNSSKLTPLSRAAEEGHLEMVNLLLARGAKHDAEDSHLGESPLCRAAGKGHIAVVKALLAHGAPADPVSSSSRESPLSRAASGGHEAVVNLLLAPPHSANPNWASLSRWYSGHTPLTAAAENGNERIVRRLLACGAEVNGKTRGKRSTALCKAVENGHESIVKLLLDKGSDVEPQRWSSYAYKDSYSPVVLAAKRGRIGILKMLLEKWTEVQRIAARSGLRAGGTKNLNWETLTPAVKEAATADHGNDEVVALLLDTMVELVMEGSGNSRETSRKKVAAGLHWVSWRSFWYRHDKESMVKALLEFGADPNIMDEYGTTPLCKVEDLTVARLLLEAGALPNRGRDRSGRTPLLIATELRSTSGPMVKLLLAYKADLEIKDKDGCTPLLRAAQRGSLDIVRLLVEAGANLETEDEEGRTPLSWAGWNRHDNVVKYLLEAGADPDAYLGEKPRVRGRRGWY
ncbi:Ankyrin-1 [Dactylella cylindrospora]|nr:Ankyrin-1 [Dactylella cylindrospora]